MNDSVALVTGAGGNIGRAVAATLAEAGATLVLADLPAAQEGLEATRSACSKHGATTLVTTFDVCDDHAVDQALREATAVLGPITLAVNNAGYQGRFENTADYDLDDARRVFEINVLGVLTVLQVWARLLRDNGRGGSIVNVASMAYHGAANMPAYSASKGAVVSLTKAAAKDLAPFDIRVNSVSPGFIGPGAMWDRQVAEQAATPSPYYADDEATVAEQMIGAVPLRRYGSLDEVASVVRFLLSDESSYMTGSDLEIAGGV